MSGSDQVTIVVASDNVPKEIIIIPDHFEAETGCKNTKNVKDFNIEDKTRGFLSLGPTKFKFVGPDRDLCSNIEEVLHVANVIQATDLDKRLVILNLSHPHGASLNDNVDKEYLDGSPFSLRFPSIDNIVQHISGSDTEILLSKIDVSRAFRNLRVDPADAIKFIKWKDHYYLDLEVAFGWIHGFSSFQLVADVIRYIMNQKGFQVFAYIDDFILVNPKHKAREAFDTLYNLLTELGLPMNEDKTVPPSSKLTYLGINIDIPNNTLSIDSDKVQAIHDVCANMITKKFITERQMQSLLGKLLYLHKCVKPARIFVNCILCFLGIVQVKEFQLQMNSSRIFSGF